MKPALAFRQPHYPNSWQALPNGKVIKEAIEHELSFWWPKFFGYHLLKLGASHKILTPEGKSAFTFATASGNNELAKLLR